MCKKKKKRKMNTKTYIFHDNYTDIQQSNKQTDVLKISKIEKAILKRFWVKKTTVTKQTEKIITIRQKN